MHGNQMTLVKKARCSGQKEIWKIKKEKESKMLSSLELSYHCIHLAIKSSIIVKLVGIPGVVLSLRAKWSERIAHKN